MKMNEIELMVWAIATGESAFNVSDDTEPFLRFLYKDNTIIGYSFLGSYVVLTLEKVFLPVCYRNRIVKEAMNFGLSIIFVPGIDIGFGHHLVKRPINYVKRQLRAVAQLSTDDVKTAVVGGVRDIADKSFTPYMYTFNHVRSYGKEHTETILSNFIIDCYRVGHYIDKPIHFLSDLEPCCDCLNRLIEAYAVQIFYMTDHKEKWNTREYLQLVNDIHAGRVLSTDSQPRKVLYRKERAR